MVCRKCSHTERNSQRSSCQVRCAHFTPSDVRECTCIFSRVCRYLTRASQRIECTFSGTREAVFNIYFLYSRVWLCERCLQKWRVPSWRLASRMILEPRTSQSRTFSLSPRELRQPLHSGFWLKALTSGPARLLKPRQRLGPSSRLDKTGRDGDAPSSSSSFASAVKARLQG